MSIKYSLCYPTVIKTKYTGFHLTEIKQYLLLVQTFKSLSTALPLYISSFSNRGHHNYFDLHQLLPFLFLNPENRLASNTFIPFLHRWNKRLWKIIPHFNSWLLKTYLYISKFVLRLRDNTLHPLEKALHRSNNIIIISSH